MKEKTKKAIHPKLSNYERKITFLYGVIIPILAIIFSISNVYNPLLAAVHLPSMYDDLLFHWLWAMIILAFNTIFVSRTMLKYRYSGDATKAQKRLRIIFITTAIEFYYRVFQLFINDTPGEWNAFFGTFVTPFIFTYLIYYILLIIFYKKVSAHAESETSHDVSILGEIISKTINAPTTEKNLEEKLTEIQDLKDKGLISETEYESKRASILS